MASQGKIQPWQIYQHAVALLFQGIPDARVEEDVKEVGRDSKVERQLDVCIHLPIRLELGQGITPTIDLKIIVDAKWWSRKIDVTAVGHLAELRQDVRADLLIAVTPLIPTKGAANLQKARGVHILTASPDLLALLQDKSIPEAVVCAMCETGTINWEDPTSWLDIEPTLALRGSCDYCSELTVRCGDCGMIQALPTGHILRCPGGCGAIGWVEDNAKEGTRLLEWYDRLDMALLTASGKPKTKRLSFGATNKIIEKTRWKHWQEASPTINLTEQGLMEWRDNGYLYLTAMGQQVLHEFSDAEESIYWDFGSLISGAGLTVLLGSQSL